MNIARVPAPGAKRVLPGPDQRVLTPRPSTPPREGLRAAGPQDWFWEMHATARSAARPTRWSQAIDSLRARRGTGDLIVSETLVRRIVTEHGVQIRRAAERHTVSAALITAVIAVESAGRQTAVSHAGAQGLMQLIPATARRFGVDDSFDPAKNIEGGAAYLSWLLNRFGQDPILALAGYNAGEGAVDKHDGVPPFRETRDYVVKVFDGVVASEHLCARAPITPRHPCDWAGAGS
ncbi:MAG: transglycosylase SLT domain-containing protein [Pseudomonadota bacterium]